MISALSVRSIKIEAINQHNNKPMGKATGFFCKYKTQQFFITNWHVVTGLNPYTNKSETGARPGLLRCKTIAKNPEKEAVNGITPSQVVEFDLPLYEETGEPSWIEHPEYGQTVDVVAIPIEGNQEVLHVYDVEDEIKRLQSLTVMSKVFIIGFSLGEKQTNNYFPIYKGATVASEPTEHLAEPRVHLDSKTKPGMSGSPVVCEHQDPPKMEGTNIVFPQITYSLVGVYAGRDGIPADEYTAELGRMYPIKECLIPILETTIVKEF